MKIRDLYQSRNSSADSKILEDVDVNNSDTDKTKASKQAYNKGGLQGLKAHLLKTKPRFAKEIEPEFDSLEVIKSKAELDNEVDDMLIFFDQLGENTLGPDNPYYWNAVLPYNKSADADLADRLADRMLLKGPKSQAEIKRREAEIKRLNQKLTPAQKKSLDDYNKKMKAQDAWKDTAISEDESNNAAVSKIIAKALGENTLEQTNPYEPTVPYRNSTQKDLDDRIAKRDAELKRLKQLSGTDIEDYKKKMKANNDWKDTAVSEDESNDAAVSKIIAKALGDDSKWTEMSPQELFAELESTSPELADTISDIARMIYGVRLPEGRPYQDLGVGDAVMGADGKEYKFDANKQMFVATDTTNPSQHAVTTKFGADLKRRRTNLNAKLNRINRQT